jgi:RNA polymerase sigma-70 factor, ECF subfamily
VFAGGAIRSLTMTEADIHDQISQPEFEAFYLRTSRTLHGYLCRLSRDPATADEVLQEAYVRMINAPAMEESHRKAYLYTAATNILRDRWRRQKREQQWWQLSQVSGPVHHNLSLPVDMAAIFDKLSAQERAVLWLAHVEELSHKEIGVVLGVKEKSVKVLVFRAREKAKSLLEKAGFGVAHE